MSTDKRLWSESNEALDVILCQLLVSNDKTLVDKKFVLF